jgi:hypothetical protein
LGARVERVERLGNLSRGDRHLVGGKARLGAIRRIDHVAAEQEHLAGIERFSWRIPVRSDEDGICHFRFLVRDQCPYLIRRFSS